MENRSVAVCVILSLVTCGIYSIYWLYKIAQGFYYAQTYERVNTSPGMTVLLFYLTCGIYGYYCYYKWGRASTEIAYRYGRTENDKAVIYLVLAIFGFAIINDALIQSDFNDWLSSPPPPPPGGYQPPPEQPPGGYHQPPEWAPAQTPPPPQGYGY